MRKLVGFGMLVGCLWAAPGAHACEPRGGGGGVEIIVIAPSPLASQQSQTFLADATRLDTRAATEESASSTQLLNARALRRRAASIRVQAVQVSEPSRSALLVKAARLDAQAAAGERASATFLARAKLIRQRARALRALSARVLASGPVAAQTLPAVTLPAPPAGHPDAMALRTLEAAPRAAAPKPRPMPHPMPPHRKAPTIGVVARL